MPEFKELDSQDGVNHSADNIAETSQTTTNMDKGMAKGRNQRRRNPISSKTAKATEPAKSIGPFEIGSKDAVKLASNERCCGGNCKKNDRRYSTDVVSVPEQKCEKSPRQFRRKESEGCAPKCSQRTEAKAENCKCCSFLKRILKKVWPFGKKADDGRGTRNSSRGDKFEGNNRRRRSSGSQNRRSHRFSNDSSHQR